MVRLWFILLFWLSASAIAKTHDAFVLTLFDVGQGDGFRIKWHRDCLWLDFGNPYWGRTIGNHYVLGRHECDRSWFVASHLDWDHIGGLSHLSKLYAISEVFLPSAFMHPRFQNARNKLAQMGISLSSEMPKALARFIDVIWPPKDSNAADFSGNDLSLVWRIWDAQHQICALLTSDISQRIERHILDRIRETPCPILKVAHHGSKSATSEIFLDTLNPQVALISSAWQNNYGHPHTKILRRLHQRGIWVFRTDWMGRIDVIARGHNLYVKTAKGEGRILLSK